MQLSDKEIEKYIKKKKIKIYPLPPKKYINGTTIDIRLGNRFKKFSKNKNYLIDLTKNKKKINNNIKYITKKEIILKKNQSLIVKSKEFILANTKEYIILPNNIVGYIDGRSSIARLGLMIHATSNKIDPGWEGKLVLEIFNYNNLNIKIKPNIRIATINFHYLFEPSIRPYNKRKKTKYKKQKSILLKI